MTVVVLRNQCESPASRARLGNSVGVDRRRRRVSSDSSGQLVEHQHHDRRRVPDLHRRRPRRRRSAGRRWATPPGTGRGTPAAPAAANASHSRTDREPRGSATDGQRAGRQRPATRQRRAGGERPRRLHHDGRHQDAEQPRWTHAAGRLADQADQRLRQPQPDGRQHGDREPRTARSAAATPPRSANCSTPRPNRSSSGWVMAKPHSANSSTKARTSRRHALGAAGCSAVHQG